MQSYRSDHPNQFHQLSVSVSKHYYASKDGALKYQEKPFEVALAKLAEAKKDHLVVYSIRDHTSGLFYIEAAFASNLISIQDFLRRAWLPKAELALHGLPGNVVLPKTVLAMFPEVESLVLRQSVNVADAKNGYYSGAPIAIKELEKRLAFYIGESASMASRAANSVCRTNDARKGRVKGKTKAEMWRQCNESIRLPSADF